MTLMIGTPMGDGKATAEYVQSLCALLVDARDRIDIHLEIVPGEALLPRARHRIAHAFLKSPCTHLLFIDSDEGFRSEDIFGMLDAEKDIVVGVAPQKTIDWTNIAKAANGAYSSGDSLCRAGAKLVVNFFPEGPIAGDKNCVEVRDGGTGFMLIRREVFEKIAAEYPELYFVGDQYFPGEHMVDFFAPMIDIYGHYLPEDFAFCRRWQAIGGKVHAYVPAQIKHIGKYVYEGNLEDQLKEIR